MGCCGAFCAGCCARATYQLTSPVSIIAPSTAELFFMPQSSFGCSSWVGREGYHGSRGYWRANNRSEPACIPEALLITRHALTVERHHSREQKIEGQGYQH